MGHFSVVGFFPNVFSTRWFPDFFKGTVSWHPCSECMQSPRVSFGARILCHEVPGVHLTRLLLWTTYLPTEVYIEHLL